MNYSEWLLQEFPELADSTCVKRFDYVKKAKFETRRLRIITSTLTFLCSVIFGFCIGYILGKYTDFDLWLVITITVAVSVFISNKYLNKIEYRIVQKKLTELVVTETAER